MPLANHGLSESVLETSAVGCASMSWTSGDRTLGAETELLGRVNFAARHAAI